MTQDLTYWAFTGVDGFGQSLFSAPVTVQCRWQDKQDLFRDTKGQEKISTAIIYPVQPLIIKGFVKLGIDATADPLGLFGAYEIRQAGVSPALDGVLLLNKVWV
jgi:hypothetical protein